MGSSSYEVVVIGASQAGLAIGYHLAQRGVRFVILDARSDVGQVWRSRWDSLRPFTPAQYSSLPGMAFPLPTRTQLKDDANAASLTFRACSFSDSPGSTVGDRRSSGS
jgi:putative flavoprotein involved in K+ transport